MSRRRSFEIPGVDHENPIPMACRIGSIVMSSGISGIDPQTGKAPSDIDEQCRLMFANVRRVMESVGGSPDDIIKMLVWSKERSYKNNVNKEWLAMFPDEHSRPARHTMIYTNFAGSVLIQCEITAVLSSDK